MIDDPEEEAWRAMENKFEPEQRPEVEAYQKWSRTVPDSSSYVEHSLRLEVRSAELRAFVAGWRSGVEWMKKNKND